MTDTKQNTMLQAVGKVLKDERAETSRLISEAVAAVTAKAGPVGPAGAPADPEAVAKLLTNDAAFLRAVRGSDADASDIIRRLKLDSDFLAAVKGLNGEPGPEGKPGDRGPRGEQGPQGHMGKEGMPGPKGIKGDKGDKGDDGKPGEAGPQGETGETGGTGKAGAPGAAGERGPDGMPGPIGKTGPQGPQGPVGPNGEKGDRGETGPEGKPADTEAVAKALAGDKPFLLSIKGETGPQGEKGEAGIDRPLIAPYSITKDSRLDKGDVAVFRGGLFQATRKTQGDPDTDPESWRCLVSGIAGCHADHDPKKRMRTMTVLLSDGTVVAHEFEDLPRHVHPDEQERFVCGDFNFSDEGEFRVFEGREKGWRKFSVIGPEGARGRKGAKGDTGAEGRGLSDIAFEVNDAGFHFAVTWSDGEVTRRAFDKDVLVEFIKTEIADFIAEAVAPDDAADQTINRFAGTWRHDKEYRAGDVVSGSEGLFLANRDAPKGTKLLGTETWGLLLEKPPARAAEPAGNPGIEMGTTDRLKDASDELNLSGKHEGKMVFDATSNRIMVALGSSPTAGWGGDGKAILPVLGP